MKLIYGAGRYGQAFLQAAENAGERVAGFIDQFNDRREIAGRPVWRVAEAPREHSVIISIPQQTMSRTVGIAGLLAEAGFDNLLDFNQAIERYPEMPRHLASSNLLWMRPRAPEMLDQAALQQLARLLRDQTSKEVLARLIRFRETLHGSDYPRPDGQIEYFPADIPWCPSEPLRFVDGGAWIGDTVESLFDCCEKLGHEVEWVAAFEPDRENLEQLNETILTLSCAHDDSRMFIWPGGLWSENCLLNFSSGEDSASHVEPGGQGNKETIPAVALDQILRGSRPNYIKLDIEGAEMAALRGAQRLIEENRPNMAICLYHRPEDLWEIPLWIATRWPAYSLYLRLHGPMGLSTVLYCINRENGTCPH